MLLIDTLELDLSFSSDVRRRVRARAGVRGFPLSSLPLFSHLLHRRALYPLRLVRCSVPGVLSASSSHVRSSGVDVVQLGGGVTTRGWSVCVRWSRLLGFCREFLKLLGGTKAHRGGRLAHCSRLSCGPWSLSTLEVPFNSKSRLASTPACVGVVVFGAGSIVVVHWRSVVYGLFVALLGCSSQSLSLFSAACDQYSSGAMSTSRSIFLVQLASIVPCPLSCFVRGIRVSIDFESPSCLGVLKIVQAVHERFPPCYSGGVTGVPGIRGNEVNLTVPWSTLMVENSFRFLRILKST
ncbi:hypothetical protein Bca101_096768 [Brassica carinata]